MFLIRSRLVLPESLILSGVPAFHGTTGTEISLYSRYAFARAFYIVIYPDQKLFRRGSDMAVWDGAVIRRILRRKAYYGAVVTHTQESKDLFSKHKTSIPEEEQFVVEGMHEPIVKRRIVSGGFGGLFSANSPTARRFHPGECGLSAEIWRTSSGGRKRTRGLISAEEAPLLK